MCHHRYGRRIRLSLAKDPASKAPQFRDRNELVKRARWLYFYAVSFSPGFKTEVNYIVGVRNQSVAFPNLLDPSSFGQFCR